MKHLVVLTGAGISAESGLQTFRDNGGLWEEHDIYEIATPQAWRKNQALVLDFYNARRKQLQHVKPNRAHDILVELESFFEVSIITQNVDDLHERAGSSSVLHLHGELTKARSALHADYVVDWGYNAIKPGDSCPAGGQLRPHVVWFGEDVPMIAPATTLIEKADLVLVVGTSLTVYPAAGLLFNAPKSAPVFLIDPQADLVGPNVTTIKASATVGMQRLKTKLLKDYT